MTKKDYILIASVIEYNQPSRVAKPKGYEERLEAWTNILNGLIEAFQDENPRFDANKFLKACGVKTNDYPASTNRQ